MHPAIKALMIAYEVARTIDDMTEGKLRKSGKELIKKIEVKRGQKT